MGPAVWCVLAAVTGAWAAPADLPMQMLRMMWAPLTSPPPAARPPPLYRNRRPGEGPVVSTQQGDVRGFFTTTARDGAHYAAFLGIPYAAPPTGRRRFLDPEGAVPWAGVRDATFERPTCLNFMKTSEGREDCLYLNVYTPGVEPGAARAVMVYIHGGAFLGGSSNTTLYSPDFLIDRGVVLVIFNYRLGPLGFLSLQNEVVPGNAGLKDQAMALLWVKNNIRSFGGDPTRVTIFGESAGSASVSYHVLSAASAGLFAQAIMQSGTALSPWAHTPPRKAQRKAFMLGERLGCVSPTQPGDKTALLECLWRQTPDLIVQAQEEAITAEEVLTLRPFPFLPTTEPAVKGAFLSRSPQDHLTSGDFNKVPVILGSNNAEGLMVLPVLKKFDPAGALVVVVGQDMTKLIPQPVSAAMTSAQSNAVTGRMREFYFHNQLVTMFHRRDMLDLLTDVQFLWQIQQTALLMARHSPAPVYNYYITYDGPYGLYKTSTEIEEERGVCHADELGYLFWTSSLEERYNGHKDRSRPEEKMIDLITRLWTDFAKTGDPTPRVPGPAGSCLPTWLPFTTTEYHYYEIGLPPRAGQHLQQPHVQFWNDVFALVTGAKYFTY